MHNPHIHVWQPAHQSGNDDESAQEIAFAGTQSYLLHVCVLLLVHFTVWT